MVRSGVSFKINETFIELWRNSRDDSDDDDIKSSTTISQYEDEDDEDDNLEYSNCCHSNSTHLHEIDEDISEEIYDRILHQETKFSADDMSGDEGDSLLVAFDKNSVISLWHEYHTRAMV